MVPLSGAAAGLLTATDTWPAAELLLPLASLALLPLPDALAATERRRASAGAAGRRNTLHTLLPAPSGQARGGRCAIPR